MKNINPYNDKWVTDAPRLSMVVSGRLSVPVVHETVGVVMEWTDIVLELFGIVIGFIDVFDDDSVLDTPSFLHKNVIMTLHYHNT